MPKTFFEKWESRLDSSHRYWVKKGLTGDDEGNVFADLLAYRGIQWGGDWGSIPAENLITVNQTFSNTNTMISQLSKRNPKVVTNPKRPGSEQMANARRMQLVLQYFWEELKIKRQVDQVLRDALLLPFGFLQVGFTPSEEKFSGDGNLINTYDQARPDMPWLRRRACWDVRMDPLAADWQPDGSTRWVAFRDYLFEEEIKGNPGMKFPRDLTAILSKDGRDNLKRNTDGSSSELGEDFDGLFEIWTVWDKVERKWFSMSPGSDKFIRDPAPWPLDLEHLPYAYLAFNPQSDDNVGIQFPKMYRTQQIEINKLRTLMSEFVKRMRRFVVVNDASLELGEAEKLDNADALMEFLHANGDVANVMKESQVGGFDPNLITYDALIKNDIRETLGLSNLDRAQRINVETATEAQGVIQGSAIHLGRNQETFENFLSDAMRIFGQALQLTLDDKLHFRITGIQDQLTLNADNEGFVSLDPQDIHGEFDYKVGVGSTLPENENEELAKLLQLFQIFQQDTDIDQRELKRNIIEAARQDANRLFAPPEVSQGAQDQLAAQGGESGPANGSGGGGLDLNALRSLNPGGAQ